jgi:hypothetical protein
MIELLADSEQRRLREIATQAAEDFHDSVLAIYGSSAATNRLPEHIGSCILLDIDGTPVVATAAHIADKIPEGTTLFVAGPTRPQLVPILSGDIKTTIPPRGDRELDHSDSAYWRIPADVVVNLGAANFLGPSRLAYNRAPLERRYYTALGYAVSRNDPLIDHEQRSIASIPSMYTSNAGLDPALERKLRMKLGASGDEHIFMRYPKEAQDADGATMKTFYPEGLSGGAFLDLGDFTSCEIYAGDTKHRARLAAVIIEYHEKKYRALVAVKIGPIVNGIRNALQRGSAIASS